MEEIDLGTLKGAIAAEAVKVGEQRNPKVTHCALSACIASCTLAEVALEFLDSRHVSSLACRARRTDALDPAFWDTLRGGKMSEPWMSCRVRFAETADGRVDVTVVDEAEIALPTDPALGPGRVVQQRLRRRRGLMASAIALIALVFLVPVAWSAVQEDREGPESDAFAKFSGSSGGFARTVGQGEQYTFSLTSGPLPDVTVLSARVIVSKDSVAAATAVSICRADSGRDGDTAGIDPILGGSPEGCSEVVSVEGQDLGVLRPKDSLIATVAPLVDGRIQVTGIELAYERAGRVATERVSAEFTIE